MCTHIKVRDENSYGSHEFLWFPCLFSSERTFIYERRTKERCIIKYALCTHKNKYNDFDIKALPFMPNQSRSWVRNTIVAFSLILIVNNETIKFLMQIWGLEEIKRKLKMTWMAFLRFLIKFISITFTS